MRKLILILPFLLLGAAPMREHFLPPGAWWREPEFADTLKLSDAQIEKLNELHKTDGEQAARIERDLMTVTRDLRTALDQKNVVADNIIAAGERLGVLREELFRRQIALLAKQRTILTHAQWTTLQEQLESERRPRMGERGQRPGAFGGRGPGRRRGRP